MSALAFRDTLAKALYVADLAASNLGEDAEWEQQHEITQRVYVGQADALLASGAVVDAATLADNEALVEQVTRQVCAPALEWTAYTDFTRDHLRALTAALSERGDVR